MLNLKKKCKNKRLSKNEYSNTISKLNKVGIEWLTVSNLKMRVNREYDILVKKSFNEDPPPPGVSFASDTASNDLTSSRKAGRPKGTTKAHKREVDKRLTLAKNEITKMYKKQITGSKRCERGKFEKIVGIVKNHRNLPQTFSFSYGAAKKRVSRNVPVVMTPGMKSPLHEIEESFVEIIIALADCGNPATVGQCLFLMQSLIQNTKYQEKLVHWKQSYMTQAQIDSLDVTELAKLGTLGSSYYYAFMKRHREKIVSKRGIKFDLNRTSWTQYGNFQHMYEDVEDLMIEAGVAKKRDIPVWKNKKGEVVSAEDSYGYKVGVELTHPHCCLVLDEVGGDTNMIKDSAAHGTKYVGRNDGSEVRSHASKKAKKFTVLGVTALNGEAVMCVLIIQGKERNIFMESGIDTTNSVYLSEDDIEEKVSDDISFFRENYGPGKLFPGGPVCKFMGKDIPTLIRYTDGGGINGDILTDILKTIDQLDIFAEDRRNGVKPFILLDGHQSRFSLPFLTYITNASHPWKVSIGVPYGTALWQVGDSSQQNGRFKVRLSEEKKDCYTKGYVKV